MLFIRKLLHKDSNAEKTHGRAFNAEIFKELFFDLKLYT